MTTRSPYPDTGAAEISLPTFVLDQADERGAAAPLMGPADQGTASPLTGLGAAGTTTLLMGPADRGTTVSPMGPADLRTVPDRVSRGLRSPTDTGTPGRQPRLKVSVPAPDVCGMSRPYGQES
jgi:hypothetical protein